MEYRRILLVAVASLIFLAACCSNPTDNEADKGIIVALSDPDGAFIYIDGELQSNTTPAQFELDVATYIIKVAKLGYDVDPESVVVSIEKDATDTVVFALTPSSDTSYISVSADYDYVPIYIDGVPAEAFTPAVVPVAGGSHSVSIAGWVFEAVSAQDVDAIAGDTVDAIFDLDFRRCALIEEFSHVNCSNCPEAAEAVHSTVEDNADSVVSIEWHPQQSGGTDPFHVDNPEIHDGRVSYYGFTGIPRVFVAGQQVPDPTSASAVSAYVVDALSATGDASKVKLWGVADGEGEAHLGIIAQGISAEGVIEIAVVEKHRHYDSAPGINGMTDFYNVPRELYIYPSSGTMTLEDGVVQYIDLSGISIPVDGVSADYSYIIWFQRDADGLYSAGENILCSPGKLETFTH